MTRTRLTKGSSEGEPRLAGLSKKATNEPGKTRYIIPPCYHILFCLGKKKEWAGQFQTSYHIDILQQVAILYTP